MLVLCFDDLMLGLAALGERVDFVQFNIDHYSSFISPIKYPPYLAPPSSCVSS